MSEYKYRIDSIYNKMQFSYINLKHTKDGWSAGFSDLYANVVDLATGRVKVVRLKELAYEREVLGVVNNHSSDSVGFYCFSHREVLLRSLLQFVGFENGNDVDGDVVGANQQYCFFVMLSKNNPEYGEVMANYEYVKNGNCNVYSFIFDAFFGMHAFVVINDDYLYVPLSHVVKFIKFRIKDKLSFTKLMFMGG